MKKYDFQKIEKKWQKKWENSKSFQAQDFSKKQKYYILVEFPYPSGVGLHVGHIRSYSALDVVARKKRMQGKNVLFPIGWDAFGLPTENYAIKHKIAPQKATKDNVDNFRKQLKSLGMSFDWSREVNTTDPSYYKWTQWIFLKMYEHGLAYKKRMPINWCTKCKIGLANEEVVNGVCERCGGKVVKKEKAQWMLAITKYADRLIKDLDEVNYLDKIKTQQINWIGKSNGALIKFKIDGIKDDLEVFTTRADTLFGVTYMVVAPEHRIVDNYISQIENIEEVQKYIEKSKTKSDLVRADLDKEKTGVELKGIKAINPINKKKIPIFVADYVLPSYGTGAIMAVPAHDKRDWEFAKKYKLPIVEVIKSEKKEKLPFSGEGKLINSQEFNGIDSDKAKIKVTEFVHGKEISNYKLRDWIFSRQHYWGEPIPIIDCPKCGWVTVPEKELPVKLPKVRNYEPTDTGESPLSKIKKWVNVKCPKCGCDAKRETDTMPNWAGSSWYFLRYIDPNNNNEFASNDKLKYWLPVDLYNGGMEHTTLHLLYSRFWYKFLSDIKVVPGNEPYARRHSHGMVLAEGGIKMSKSKGNVVNPDSIVKEFGADALRIYEMFMGPFEETISWDTNGVRGVKRFVDKVWNYYNSLVNNDNNCTDKAKNILNTTIKKVDKDIENFRFNTAISQMMIFVNFVTRNNIQISKDDAGKFLKVLFPFAPHLSEELWSVIGNKGSISLEKWPESVKNIEMTQLQIPVMINGKKRALIIMKANINLSKEEIINIAFADENVKRHIKNKKIKKTIYVPGKVVSIVV